MVIVGWFVVVCGSLGWFAVFQWTAPTTMARKTCTLDSFLFFGIILVPKDNPFIVHIELHYSW